MTKCPIIKIFFTDNMEAKTEEHINTVRAALISEANRAQLRNLLDKHSIRALIIAPEEDRVRALDKGTEVTFNYLKGEQPVSDLQSIVISRKACEILGIPGAASSFFNREHEAPWGKAFVISDPALNPVRQIFDELDHPNPTLTDT